MKWFGGKAGRDAARPALSRGGMQGGFGRDDGWPQGYDAQLRAAYLGNPVAQRAVRLVAEGVGGAPVTASDPVLLTLVTARSGGQPLLESVAAQLVLHGNAFVQGKRGLRAALPVWP